MKFLVIFGVVLVVAIALGQNAKPESGEADVPEQFEEEGKTIMDKITALNLPKAADGVHPDICKITDAATKKMVMDFITKVNAAGGNLPKPNC